MKVRFPIDKIIIKNALDIYKIMQMVLKREHEVDRNKEHFWVLALSEENKILSLELVALGCNNRVYASAGDILAIPLQKQARGVILVHNHPSGSLQPSEADKDFTDRMIQICRLTKTPVLDHVIINEHSYLSFKETSLLERLEGSIKYIPPYDLEKMSYQGGWKEGKAEGEKKGIKKGRQEGEKKGIEKGIEARNLEIAKHMLSKGVDMQFICEMTGLSKTKVNALK